MSELLGTFQCHHDLLPDSLDLRAGHLEVLAVDRYVECIARHCRRRHSDEVIFLAESASSVSFVNEYVRVIFCGAGGWNRLRSVRQVNNLTFSTIAFLNSWTVSCAEARYCASVKCWETTRQSWALTILTLEQAWVLFTVKKAHHRILNVLINL